MFTWVLPTANRRVVLPAWICMDLQVLRSADLSSKFSKQLLIFKFFVTDGASLKEKSEVDREICFFTCFASIQRVPFILIVKLFPFEVLHTAGSTLLSRLPRFAIKPHRKKKSF